MRVLVEQITREIETWRERLGLGEELGVHSLLGGHIDQAWEALPERELIIVGTQDQLLSRALNRGFAMSRFRWPMHFGLLHNDAWWVLDEVQLMGPGLRTAAQLEGLRSKLGTYGCTGTTFVSATLDPTWLDTPDYALDQDSRVALDNDDWQQEALQRRTTASKPLAQAPETEPAKLAPWIARVHRPGSLTLVVVNQVQRAQKLARRLAKEMPDVDRQLIHSRFRAGDRAAAEAKLVANIPDAGRVVVATQTVEAGVDISATTLVTDLAPWASLVQRFGRCNRRGEIDNARVFWVDIDTTKGTAAAPYAAEQLDAARTRLARIENARIQDLSELDLALEWPVTDIPRRRDVIGLFDTDPDLDGNFVDISRWVRGEGDTDVSVFWRDVAERPTRSTGAPHRSELCQVSVRAFRDFVKRRARNRAWQWDPLDGRWVRAHTNPAGAAPGFVTAGQTYLVSADAGGYSTDVGWDERAKGRVPVATVADVGPPNAFALDPRSRSKTLVALDAHLRDAHGEARAITEAVSSLLHDELAEHVCQAAGWHDVGKAHPVFQRAATRPTSLEHSLLAKASSFAPYERVGFRHELVSALLAVRQGLPDLVAYLVAAHHGKVRLGLRPLQWSEVPPDTDTEVRGVRADDPVPSVDTPLGASPPAPPLPLAFATMGRGDGGPSWNERVLRLLESLGPFRLAYLETLVRVADWRASAEPGDVLEVEQ